MEKWHFSKIKAILTYYEDDLTSLEQHIERSKNNFSFKKLKIILPDDHKIRPQINKIDIEYRDSLTYSEMIDWNVCIILANTNPQKDLPEIKRNSKLRKSVNFKVKDQPVFSIDLCGRLHPLNQEARTLFSKRSNHKLLYTNSEEGWHKGLHPTFLVPYGFRILEPGLTDLDENLFRPPYLAHELGFGKIGSKTKKVAIYGGSGAFGHFSPKYRDIGGILAQNLNKEAAKKKFSFYFDVYNFGNQGGVITDTIVNWSLFGKSKEFDIVILHDGWNELFGMIYKKTYSLGPNLITRPDAELHGVLNQAMRGQKGPNEVINFNENVSPEEAVELFLNKRNDFTRLLRLLNIKVISGLQPIQYQRKNPHLAEIHLNSKRQDRGDPPDPQIISKAFSLTNESKIVADIHVDQWDEINDADSGSLLFWDPVHPTFTGETFIADRYYQEIMKIL